MSARPLRSSSSRGLAPHRGQAQLDALRPQRLLELHQAVERLDVEVRRRPRGRARAPAAAGRRRPPARAAAASSGTRWRRTAARPRATSSTPGTRLPAGVALGLAERAGLRDRGPARRPTAGASRWMTRISESPAAISRPGRMSNTRTPTSADQRQDDAAPAPDPREAAQLVDPVERRDRHDDDRAQRRLRAGRGTAAPGTPRSAGSARPPRSRSPASGRRRSRRRASGSRRRTARSPP